MDFNSEHDKLDREHMFDKVVTPSDVGKLNRLVIPKQHAEKYFPLDTSTNDKGLILNFQDHRTGKPWRFRYSYWNSSQSYVMTKGWSRFVKEKKIDAGDIVSFHRGNGEREKRLFIDWRRRQLMPPPPPPPPIHTWSPIFLQPSPRSYCYTHLLPPNNTAQPSSYVYLTPGGGTVSEVFQSMPVVPATAKKLRLFGVTMECPASGEELVLYDSSSSSPSHNDNKGKSSITSLELEM